MSAPSSLAPTRKARSNHVDAGGKSTAMPGTRVLEEIAEHVLLDGFRIVIDLEKSKGSYLYDSAHNRRLIDLYGFFGSNPIGFNHPYLQRPEVEAELLRAAKIKIANSDIYSEGYARFLRTFWRVMGLEPLRRMLLIDGGALAVENCLKAAMDWKVRKNVAAGRGERGTEILHFRRAFHGRSGYAMSLTNTDPRKTDLFAQFDWPRVSKPSIDFSLAEPERTKDVVEREKRSEVEIMQLVREKGVDIAAIIIEPIQGEGGDNHFRGEWLQNLRRICDENEMLLIFDEVQCGMGATGRNWASEHFGVLPDLMSFGKKAQVCGVMAGPRLDEVKDNVFRLPSRINSTWGGNYTDMVRSTYFLQVIEQENLVENAGIVGEYFLQRLLDLQKDHSLMSAVRGRGLFIAFDLPDPETRDALWKDLFDNGVLTLKSGDKAIRFRPALDISKEVVDEAVGIIGKETEKLAKQ